MKSTGIIRKLDGLGRIVIPIEFRKRNDIRFLDPLEIIATDDGDIILRKVDIAVQFTNSGGPVADELSRCIGKDVMLSGVKRILAASGGAKVSPSSNTLGEKAQAYIEGRKIFNGKAEEIGLSAAKYAAIVPVYAESLFGSLIVLSDSPVTDEEVKIASLSAKILAIQMQRF
jgi:transcriptional pleiotropic regulator of transition state genes